MSTGPEGVTQLLMDWSNGNREALDRLMPLVYEELRRLAKRLMAPSEADTPFRAKNRVSFAKCVQVTVGPHVDVLLN